MVKHTQTIRQLLPTNCLSVFNHLVGLALKGLNIIILIKQIISKSRPRKSADLDVYISGTSLFVIFSDFLSFYFCRLKGRAERHTFTLFSNLSCARLHVPKCLIEIVYRVLHYIFKNSALHYNIRYDFDLYRFQCIKSKLLIKRIFSTVLLCSSSI